MPKTRIAAGIIGVICGVVVLGVVVLLLVTHHHQPSDQIVTVTDQHLSLTLTLDDLPQGAKESETSSHPHCQNQSAQIVERMRSPSFEVEGFTVQNEVMVFRSRQLAQQASADATSKQRARCLVRATQTLIDELGGQAAGEPRLSDDPLKLTSSTEHSLTIEMPEAIPFFGAASVYLNVASAQIGKRVMIVSFASQNGPIPVGLRKEVAEEATAAAR